MGVALITVYIEIVPFLEYDSLCVRILYTHIPLSNETTACFTVVDRLFYTGKKNAILTTNNIKIWNVNQWPVSFTTLPAVKIDIRMLFKNKKK